MTAVEQGGLSKRGIKGRKEWWRMKTEAATTTIIETPAYHNFIQSLRSPKTRVEPLHL
jgi:hypothetical protein